MTASACDIASRISAWEFAFMATASTTGRIDITPQRALAGATTNLSSEIPNRLPCFSTTPMTR